MKKGKKKNIAVKNLIFTSKDNLKMANWANLGTNTFEIFS